MNLLTKLRILNILIFCNLLLSCDEKGDSTNLRPNPFNKDDSGHSYLNVNYTSNADTLFLAWELLTDTIEFDFYQVSESESNKIIKIKPDANSCFLTHIPYNKLVSISIALVKNEKIVTTCKKDVLIDGLDQVFAKILIPDRGSVTGGDGAISIALPDGRSIFLMGDSFMGPVTNGVRSRHDHMYRNTYILYDHGKVTGICCAKGEKSSAAIPPGVSDESKQWYWPLSGFVDNSSLYIFQSFMYQAEPGMWGFKYERTDLVEYNLPAIEFKQTMNIPFRGSKDIYFGAAAFKDSDYIYIYAQKDVDNSYNPISEALVARTTVDNLYREWEYFNGFGWTPNPLEAIKMDGLSDVAVSSVFSVFKLQDKYVLLTQEKQLFSGEIYTFLADNPYGPWYNKTLIYTTKEQNIPNLFTYNALAHPQFKKDGMILVSYNVNTGDFAQLFNDASIYRPRFFWVETDKILK